MPPRTASLTVPLPKGWTKIVRSATLHAISVAVTALTTAWGRAATSRSARQRQRAEADRLRTELALLKEELEIKDASSQATTPPQSCPTTCARSAPQARTRPATSSTSRAIRYARREFHGDPPPGVADP